MGQIDVVHVDDESHAAELAVEFLERADDRLSVHVETDPGAALDVVREEPVDCVVSDYDMPDTNGLEFLRQVRDREPDLPFVLFTGKGSEEIASRAISAGVDDYLQKDVGTDQYEVLANRIVNLVERRRAETAAARSDERYHNLVDTAPVPIVLFGADRELVYANDAAVDFLGAESEDELVGMEMPTFLHDEDVDRALERFADIVSEREAAPETEFRIRTVDGEVKRGAVATAPGQYRGQTVAQAVVYPLSNERGER